MTKGTLAALVPEIDRVLSDLEPYRVTPRSKPAFDLLTKLRGLAETGKPTPSKKARRDPRSITKPAKD